MPKQSKTIIHVNQYKIRANIKKDHVDTEPVLTVKGRRDGKPSNDYGYTAEILDKDGEIVATVVYSPHKPLSCGARVWIETYNEVIVNDQLD